MNMNMLRVRAPPVWRLESCTTPPPCSALAMLSVALRLSERGDVPAALVVPAFAACVSACAGLLRVHRIITRGIRAKSAKMRDREPPRNDRHQSTSTPLARSQTTKVRVSWPTLTTAEQCSEVPALPLNVFPHLGDSRTIPPQLITAGSLASIHQPDRVGRGSITSCCARACQEYSKLCPATCNAICRWPAFTTSAISTSPRVHRLII